MCFSFFMSTFFPLRFAPETTSLRPPVFVFNGRCQQSWCFSARWGSWQWRLAKGLVEDFASDQKPQELQARHSWTRSCWRDEYQNWGDVFLFFGGGGVWYVYSFFPGHVVKYVFYSLYTHIYFTRCFYHNLYIIMHTPVPVCPLFPPKQCLFSSKQGSLGFLGVYVYIYVFRYFGFLVIIDILSRCFFFWCFKETDRLDVSRPTHGDRDQNWGIGFAFGLKVLWGIIPFKWMFPKIVGFPAFPPNHPF